MVVKTVGATKQGLAVKGSDHKSMDNEGKILWGMCLPLHGYHVKYGSHLRHNGFDSLCVLLKIEDLFCRLHRYMVSNFTALQNNWYLIAICRLDQCLSTSNLRSMDWHVADRFLWCFSVNDSISSKVLVWKKWYFKEEGPQLTGLRGWETLHLILGLPSWSANNVPLLRSRQCIWFVILHLDS